MSVIIDTFEVVADSQNSQSSGDAQTQSSSGSAAKFPKPVDIEAVIKHQRQRMERLRAH